MDDFRTQATRAKVRWYGSRRLANRSEAQLGETLPHENWLCWVTIAHRLKIKWPLS